MGSYIACWTLYDYIPQGYFYLNIYLLCSLTLPINRKSYTLTHLTIYCPDNHMRVYIVNRVLYHNVFSSDSHLPVIDLQNLI